MEEPGIRSVCVFCGSRPGADPAFTAAARELGGLLAARRITLVYGGGRYGVMGELARAVLAAGGRVVGVIPVALVAREEPPEDLSELRVVGSMHERKALMVDLADAFVALPGGMGTLDELFEVLSWAQLGMHAKPVGLLDAAGYFERLLGFLEHALAQGFIGADDYARMLVERRADSLLERMQAWHAMPVRQWLDRDET